MVLGIFDSGLGGLSVLKEILKNNSFERIVYFGDTARVPYGDKDIETLRQYGKDDIDFLVSKGCDVIIGACGTISSTVLNDLAKNYDLKIVGIIKAAALGAKKATVNNKIGIIATSATVNTHVFKKELSDYDVVEVACPKFAPLIEKDMIDSLEMDEAIDEYLGVLKEAGIDTLVLGCTHYPLLSEKIDKYFDHKVKLINSGTILNNELNEGDYKEPVVDFYVSGDLDSFKKQAKKFLDIDGRYSFH